MELFRLHVGIDWATQAHQVCVQRAETEAIQERIVEHSGAGISAFVDWLTELSGGEPSTTGVAIEMPRGAIVETLIERGFAVFAINPSSSIGSATATRLPV